MNTARVQQLRELAATVTASYWTEKDEDDIIALCDSWLLQQAVVEAARKLEASGWFTTDAELALGSVLARLDAGSKV